MSTLYVVLLALALVGALACYTAFEPPGDREPLIVNEAGDEDEIRLSTDRSTYAEGDAMIVSIVNQSARDARITLCPGTWDRRTGAVWVRSEELMSCSTDLRPVPSGATVTETIRVALGLESGEYRVVAQVYAADDAGRQAATAASNTFAVVAAR